MQTSTPARHDARGWRLPGVANLHSHAFQRAMAGLAERQTDPADSFWTWRETMYAIAGRFTPELLQAVATQLYVEMLEAGYTTVCEFHYLHHAPGGGPYAPATAMSEALIAAAATAGIRLTLLPVLYMAGGFDGRPLSERQRRFGHAVEPFLRLLDALRAREGAMLRVGCALHSLRAVPPDAMRTVLAALPDDARIHLHIAEQTAEVEDCLTATGRRPIEWLAAEGLLDPRWQLVHATHTVPAEIDAVARAGSAAVICPSTEANLGDGLADLPGWLDAGVGLAIGSDSHVTRCWPEELRWMEYGQRLLHRKRNMAAAPDRGQPATAARLWQLALDAGGRAAGQASWGLRVGARADLLVIDTADAALVGVPGDHRLDALVFSSPGRPWQEVMVAGRWVVQARHAHSTGPTSARFADVMSRLWRADRT